MASKKNKEKKIEPSESLPEALFSAIRLQQSNLPAIPSQAESEKQTQQMLSNLLSVVSDLVITVNNNNRMNAELQVKTDAIGDRMNEILEEIRKLSPGSSNQINTTPQHGHKLFGPVKSLEELESLDSNSRNPKFVEGTISTFTRLHGKGRFPGRGLDVCHQIFNSFFDRSFMITCSWTGAGKNGKKINFSRFVNVIDLYFRVVLNADPLFSKDEVTDFLHQCLRNSKQRAKNLGGKKPVSRKRKLALRDLPEEPEEEEEEGELGGGDESYQSGDENDELEEDTKNNDELEEDSENISMKIEILDEFLNLDIDKTQ